jgi:hypothetical protein
MLGVIEACPAHVLSSPSANLYIEPDGTVRVFSTHDQLLLNNYCFSGSIFPSECPATLLHTAAVRVGKSCFAKGLFGYIGVDFVACHDDALNQTVLYGVDLNITLSHTAATFKFFDFLMQGKYGLDRSRPTAAPRLSEDASAQLSSKIIYSIEAPAGAEEVKEKSKPSSRRNSKREEVAPVVKMDRELRHYCALNHVYEPNIATFQFSAFFNLCRLKGISFDLRTKTGTAFMLWDSFAAGTLGLLAVGDTRAEAVHLVHKGIVFLKEQANQLRLGPSRDQQWSNLTALGQMVKVTLKQNGAAPQARDSGNSRDKIRKGAGFSRKAAERAKVSASSSQPPFGSTVDNVNSPATENALQPN